MGVYGPYHDKKVVSIVFILRAPLQMSLLGLSIANIVDVPMLKSMAKR
jgi:hypothetical protein